MNSNGVPFLQINGAAVTLDAATGLFWGGGIAGLLHPDGVVFSTYQPND